MPFIGQQPLTGAYSKLDAITASATATYNLLLNGGAYSPASANHLLVSLNGVIQAPQDSFTVSGSTIIFDSALTSSDNIDFIMALGDVLNIGTPSDGTVTAGKIASGAVTDAKIASGAVTDAKLASTLDLSSKTVTLPTGVGGKLLQFVSDQSAIGSSTATIPQDNTAPTITEGVEIFSRAITPTAANSNLLIQMNCQMSGSANTRYMVWALFEGNTLVGSWSNTLSYSNAGVIASFNIVKAASTTNARTYSVRAGFCSGTTGTLYYGYVSGNSYGQLNQNYMTIQEIEG